MNYHKIYNMDCIDGMKQLDDNSIDLVVTDPPYFLTSKSGKGFMGKDWDSSKDRYKFHRDWAKEALRVLKPGAFAFVMTTPRQDSLCQILMALSKAGFDMKFSSLAWCFASGFPKSQNVEKKILNDMAVEMEREYNINNVEWQD